MKKLLFLWMMTALIMLPANALADDITPGSFSATLGVGESVTVDKTVTITTAPPTSALLDVFFQFDTTGSMFDLIADAQAEASNILAGLSGFGDVAFGVGHYEDFPVSPYGGSTDVPYELVQDLTTDTTVAETAISSLTLGSGFDFPESQLFALSEMASTTSWRENSTRVAVWFGDAPGHDGDVELDYPNDIGLADAISALQSEMIVVEAVDLSLMDSTGQATAIADATEGSVLALGDDIVATIIAAVEDVFDTYSEVTLDISGAPAGVDVDFAPASYTGDFNRETEMTFDFLVTFEGLEPGVHDFVINALVDGGIVATEEDLIRVPGDGPAAVPEPATMLLVGSGLLGLAGLRRKFFK